VSCLATVLRPPCVRGSRATPLLWTVALPSADADGSSVVGSCFALGSDDQLRRDEGEALVLDVGQQAVAWLGRGHALGAVAASRGEERLLNFAGLSGQALHWFPVGELLSREEAEKDGMLQCGRCLLRGTRGFFCSDGIWNCESCSSQGK
ncbi:unnamed protein product, partial [Polarella glacialis]